MRARDFTTVSSLVLLPEALKIAFAYDRAVYDCLYAALAVQAKTEMIKQLMSVWPMLGSGALAGEVAGRSLSLAGTNPPPHLIAQPQRLNRPCARFFEDQLSLDIDGALVQAMRNKPRHCGHRHKEDHAQRFH